MGLPYLLDRHGTGVVSERRQHPPGGPLRWRHLTAPSPVARARCGWMARGRHELAVGASRPERRTGMYPYRLDRSPREPAGDDAPGLAPAKTPDPGGNPAPVPRAVTPAGRGRRAGAAALL